MQHDIIPMDKTEYFGLVIGAHLSIDIVATSHFALKHTVSLTAITCLTAAAFPSPFYSATLQEEVCLEV